VLERLTPRQKKIALALAGGGLLALIALMSRRGSSTAAAAPDAGQLGATGTLPAGTTFADNGEQAAALGTDITGALGDVSTALQDVSAGQQYLWDNLPSLVQPVGAAPTAADIAAQLGPGIAAAIAGLGTSATPSGAQTATRTTQQAQLKAGVFLQDTGSRAGLRYIVQGGQRRYESKAGKGDWGKGGSATATGPSTRAATPAPAAPATPAPAAATPAATPSRPSLPAGVFLQDAGERRGLRYIVQGGYRRYESRAGAGDWGKGGVIKR